MHQVLLQLVVKLDVLYTSCVFVVDLLKINPYMASTYIKVKDRHFWFFMEKQLTNLLNQDKIKSEDVRSFKKEAGNIIIPIVEKITEKSPLHFSKCIWFDFNNHFRNIWITCQHEKPFDSHCILYMASLAERK